MKTFVITLCAVALSIVAEAATVTGRVIDSTGAALPGVTVEMSQRGAKPVVVTTARDGNFAIETEAGTYVLAFDLINFAIAQRQVIIAGDVRIDDVVLHLGASATVVVTAAQTFRKPAEIGDSGRYADSASAGVVTSEALASRPMQRPGDVLESVPGLAVSQHSGEGKANQYYLRGFNLDHGTDVAISVAGTPVNLPTHAHGHGYADTNFLIPELLSVVQFRKGPYAADAGDFASAGTVNISYVNALEQPVAMLQGGQYGYARALVAASPEVSGGRLLYAFEAAQHDGPWDRPDDYRRLNGLLRFSRGGQTGGFSLTAMGYDARWNATDQIPERAVTSGAVTRFGLIDDSDGGLTRRYALAVEWQRTSGSRLSQVSAYALSYRLSLFSNFTYFLEDPVNGDQFEQSESRTASGAKAIQRWNTSLFGRSAEMSAGLQLRSDSIDEIGLYRTRRRERISTTRQDDVEQSSGSVFIQSSNEWTPMFRTVAGARATTYGFDVRSSLAENSGKRRASLVTPHVSVVAGPMRGIELFANAGGGFHSNDARGTTMTIDPISRDAVEPVDPLVRTRGAEIGIRAAIPRVHVTSALWSLNADSELLFVGDAGTTEATRPSRRRGVEVAAQYFATSSLLFDVEYAHSRARFADDHAAGNLIPGAVEDVVSAGALLNLSNISAEMRYRYMGPRALVEDGSVRSESSQLVSASASYRVSRRITIDVDVFNFFDAEVSDIDYFYESRLPGEAAGVSDVHFHPVEPRSVRVALRTAF